MGTWDNLVMVKMVDHALVSNQITGVLSTAPVLFLRLPLPLIDRTTDAPREKLQSLCAIWGERHGPALTLNKKKKTTKMM